MKKHFSKMLILFMFALLPLCANEFVQFPSQTFSLLDGSIQKEISTDSLQNNFIQPFKLDLLTDGIIGGTSLALAGSALLCDKVFKIKNNNISDYKFPLVKEDLNAFDRTFIQHYSKTLDYVGDGVLALTMSLPALMFTSKNTDWLTVGVMYAETLALAYGIKQWGKLIVSRPRPYMYFDDYPKGEVERGDWHCSFPSGHTTMAFTAAAFTSCIFNEYFPDSFWRHIVTAGSFGIATTVGIVRMCSGNHFATDVLTGAAIGTLCGFIVPFFHSQTFQSFLNPTENTNIAVSPLGFNVSLRF